MIKCINVEKTFYLKNFYDYVKSCKSILNFISRLFYLISNKTVNLSHKHMSMTPELSGTKALTFNIISARLSKSSFPKTSGIYD